MTFLTALRLPGSIEGDLAQLQGELFRRFGLVSARALPPLVPLCRSADPPDLFSVAPAPLPALRLGRAYLESASLLIALSPAKALRELAAHLGATGTQTGAPSPPTPDSPARVSSPPAPDSPAHALCLPAPAAGVLIAPQVAPSLSTSVLDVTERLLSDAPALGSAHLRSFQLVTLAIELWDTAAAGRATGTAETGAAVGTELRRVSWREHARRQLRKPASG
ncbi:MAG: hypothetical protein ACLFMV_11675 [Spirochaetaceae bacterium]